MLGGARPLSGRVHGIMERLAHRYPINPILRQSAAGRWPDWTMFSQITSMFLVALCRATPSHVRRARGGGRRARMSKVVDKWGSGEDEVSVAPGASMRGSVGESALTAMYDPIAAVHTRATPQTQVRELIGAPRRRARERETGRTAGAVEDEDEVEHRAAPRMLRRERRLRSSSSRERWLSGGRVDAAERGEHLCVHGGRVRGVAASASSAQSRTKRGRRSDVDGERTRDAHSSSKHAITRGSRLKRAACCTDSRPT